jgi:hypothetical protein
MHKRIILVFATLLLLPWTGKGQDTAGSSHHFILSAPGRTATIFVGKNEQEVVKTAAHMLAGDIAQVGGREPLVTSDTAALSGPVVVVGTIADPVIARLSGEAGLADLSGRWEHFMIRVVDDPRSHRKILLIAGSDGRGAAYGALTVSRLIGVSPWSWWADVTPHKRSRVTVSDDIDLEEGPSVRYRGIFINDEDWGLRPWASKTYEPSLGNIGPKTYARVFELLLRLKANTIWPAMHPGTTPFFDVKGNEAVARKYGIVVGTSHAEPMMRNNVGEWHTRTMGEFNYVTNRDSVYNYWKRRVEQVAGDEDIYTIGMRGIHDSRMQGANTVAQEAAVLSRVFKDQRGLLKKYVNDDVAKVPQVFIPYKEVLPVYDYGLKVPDDVTLMWPDDNYGYIRRLSNARERQRSGSSGVYYHLSYWGRPHDYLWLSSTQPGLIWEEMTKAWDYGAKRMWIANVGDIKPAAYNIQFFLDMAWDIDSIGPNTIRGHMHDWCAGIFGPANAGAITAVMDAYDRLAFIRRPEFMGWSQTEPRTPTRNTAFHPFLDGDEIARRAEAYRQLIARVERIRKQVPADRQDAYFELVTYPVEGAAYMNEKFLYGQKSRLFAGYGLPVANHYASLSRKAFDSIKILTRQYNSLKGGKWKYIMDMAPRGLAAYRLPQLPDSISGRGQGVLLWEEGQMSPAGPGSHDTLAALNPYSSPRHFIDLLNKGTRPVRWTAEVSDDRISLDKSRGVLQAEDKIEVTLNPDKLPREPGEASVTIKAGDSTYRIIVPVNARIKGRVPARPIVEQNGIVFMQGYDFVKKKDAAGNAWTSIQQLGYCDSALGFLARPGVGKNNGAAYLEYRFYTYSKGAARITVFTLPTHPVNPQAGMRIALSVDQGGKHVISYETKGRSEQWKQNVLSNHARCVLKYDFSQPGWHTIRVYPLDPGVIIDQLMVNFKADRKIYAVPVKNK